MNNNVNSKKNSIMEVEREGWRKEGEGGRGGRLGREGG